MSHGGLTPPAPGCTTFVRCIKRHWQCTYARPRRAAGVSPPWLEKRACRAIRFVFDERTHLDKSGGRQPAVLPKNVSATASDFRTAITFARCKQPHNHGGLRPPLLCCRANVCRQKAIFATNERTLTRAAGVSPPWLGKRVSSGETLDIYVAIQNRYPTRNTRLQRRDPEQTEDWLARVSVVGFQNGGVPIYRPIATSGLDSKSVVQSLVCWRSWPSYEEVEVCSCKCNPCKRSWPSYEGVEGNPRASPPRWRIRNRDWRL
jgi:hypothetical protein